MTTAPAARPPDAVRRVAAASLLITLGGAATAWVLAIRQMRGMGMSGGLGSLGFFAGLWVLMMAAMMLPGAAPAIRRHATDGGGLRGTTVFIGGYLAVWAVVGLAAYAVQLSPRSLTAGAVTIAAGVYELTPLKRRCRQRCREVTGELRYGLCCVGSSIGLMAALLALGVMSVGWMVAVSAAVLAQKLLPPKAAIDVPLAATIVVLGVLVVLA